jgi:hypothetical protein
VALSGQLSACEVRDRDASFGKAIPCITTYQLGALHDDTADPTSSLSEDWLHEG